MQAALLASAVVPGAEAAQHTRRGALKTAAATLIMLTGLAQPVGAETAAAGEVAVRAAVQTALRSTVPASKAPAVLRLAFHDAGTYSVSSRDGGANGSLVYELDRPEVSRRAAVERGGRCSPLLPVLWSQTRFAASSGCTRAAARNGC
jgi:hypothetical protein